MRRLSLSVAVLALGLTSVSIVPQQSAAAPLPAAYSAAAGGDLVAIDLDVTSGPDFAGARLAASQSTVDGGATPTTTASVSNLGAAVAGLGVAVQSNTQTAPPDNSTADTDQLVGVSALGLLDLGLLKTLVHARSEAIVCTATGGVLANSFVQTTGAILNPAGVGTVVDTGDSTTSGVVSFIPEPPGDPFNRGVLSSAIGNITTNNTFLNGQVGISIAGQSVLQAFASGVPGGANTTYSPGTVTVTVGSTIATVPLGGEFDTDDDLPNPLPNGRVVITVNKPIITEAPNGQTANASVAVVTADVRVGPANAPLATASVDLQPLRASAVVPPGGIDCAPVLITPTDGSTLTDTTPIFTGTGAVPGADVDIVVDGDPIGTTTALANGNFSFTPGTPIPPGDHLASARARVNGATSVPSNVNDFTILGPPVLDDPADGTVTNDTTPTFNGRTLPGAQVDILVDGDPIGTTTALANGNFSFTPATHIPAGDHLARARAHLNGATSPPSKINRFTIDAVAPAAPTLVRPSDGSVTRDRTLTFSGRAEPGAEVEVFVDGDSIGTTTAKGDGDFSFTPTKPLAAGSHEAFVGATDAAGNDSPPSNTNGFRIATDAPAAPVITSPEDGSTTTDTTFPIRGTAEPGSQVIIIRDGEEIGSTVADEDGDFTFDLPSGLLPVGRYGFSARAVDEAGNSSGAAEPVYVEVLGTQASVVDDGPGQSLADTGGPQGWLAALAVLGVLAGAGVLAIARWRRRSSHV